MNDELLRGSILDYIRLTDAYHTTVTKEIGGWLLFIANKPSRKLSAKNRS